MQTEEVALQAWLTALGESDIPLPWLAALGGSHVLIPLLAARLAPHPHMRQTTVLHSPLPSLSEARWSVASEV